MGTLLIAMNRRVPSRRFGLRHRTVCSMLTNKGIFVGRFDAVSGLGRIMLQVRDNRFDKNEERTPKNRQGIRDCS